MAGGEVASATEDPTIWAVDDELWHPEGTRLAPLLKIEKVRKKPGRPRVADRPLFDGLIWLARTGAQWAALPRVFGTKSTLHRRFGEWLAAGVLQRAWHPPAGTRVLLTYDAEIG